MADRGWSFDFNSSSIEKIPQHFVILIKISSPPFNTYCKKYGKYLVLTRPSLGTQLEFCQLSTRVLSNSSSNCRTVNSSSIEKIPQHFVILIKISSPPFNTHCKKYGKYLVLTKFYLNVVRSFQAALNNDKIYPNLIT